LADKLVSFFVNLLVVILRNLPDRFAVGTMEFPASRIKNIEGILFGAPTGVPGFRTLASSVVDGNARLDVVDIYIEETRAAAFSGL